MEDQNDRRRLTFPNRNYSDVVRLYLKVLIMDSPDLQVLQQQLRQVLGSPKNPPVGNAYRFDTKEFAVFALITSIDEESNFSLVYIAINKRMRDSNGAIVDGIFYDSITFRSTLTSNLRRKFNISPKTKELECYSADACKKITIDQFFELAKSCELINNIISGE